MSRIVVDKEKCKGCLLCVQACPQKILFKSEYFNKQGYQVMAMQEGAEEKCTGCAFCATMCPDVVITVFRTKKKTADKKEVQA